MSEVAGADGADLAVGLGDDDVRRQRRQLGLVDLVQWHAGVQFARTRASISALVARMSNAGRATAGSRFTHAG